MAYFYNNNTNFHSTPSTSGGFDRYPFLNQASTTGETNPQTLSAFADGWGFGGYPNYAVDSSRGLRAEQSLESVTPVTQYEAQTHRQGEPSFPGYYWPTTGRYAQSHHSGILSRDNSFASVAASEASTEVSAPSSVPLGYWGDSESVPSTSTFNANAQTPYQYSAGSNSAGVMQTWRFPSYGTHSVRSNEYTNAEAGPSTLAPPFTPYVAPLVTHPSGGSSEATANAEQIRSTTGADTAPTTRQPQGTGKIRSWRKQYQRWVRRLRVWAKGWECLKKLPSHEEALNVALQFVETIREPVYETPRLTSGKGTRTARGEKAPDAEQRRREGIRELNEELSRYYPLITSQGAWGCPELLSKVLRDIESIPTPPPDQSSP